jgi:hypothetical protein
MGSLTTLTDALEAAGVLDPARASRAQRISAVREHTALISQSERAIADSVATLPDLPDGEALVSALLRGLELPLPGPARPASAEAEPPPPPGPRASPPL